MVLDRKGRPPAIVDEVVGLSRIKLLAEPVGKAAQKLNYSSIMGGPTMPDPNGSTTVDSSSRDKPTSLG
jgi:hypothetical protein